MINTGDVRDCVESRWQAVAELRSVVPGGLYFGRASGSGTPYAAFAVEAEDPKVYGTRYTQAFKVTVSVWSDAGGTITGATAQQSVNAAYVGQHAVMSVRGGRVVVCKPASPGDELEDGLRAAQDVLLSKLAFRLVVEGDLTQR